jgi:ATP-dependent RNA helicase SUPV3L1/SUV3
VQGKIFRVFLISDNFTKQSFAFQVLVATDAIGMGLNLNIRRIIFYSLSKLQLLETGEKEMDLISVSQALQIAGRAGRFNTQWETGYVTCFNQEEIPTMKTLLSQQPDEILHAGLHPTFDQLEMYAYHLPHASLANLVDIFISLSTLDNSLYSLCHMDDFKFLADMIEHIPLQLKARSNSCIWIFNEKHLIKGSLCVGIHSAAPLSTGECLLYAPCS